MIHIIIIPGLGDIDGLYKLMAPLYRRHDQKAIVHSMHWNNDDGDYKTRLQQLRRYIKSIPSADTVNIIGASAGGPMALHTLFDMPDRINKICTIAAPLTTTKEISRNQTLNVALKSLQPRIAQTNKTLLSRVMSLYGRLDGIVEPKDSELPGAINVQIPGWQHNVITTLGLTLHSAKIIRFFRQ